MKKSVLHGVLQTRIISSFFVVLVAVGLFLSAFPRSLSTGQDDQWRSGLERLSETLEKRVEQGSIPGAVIMASIQGKRHFSDVLGYQDIASQSPMTEKTLFRLYSMSKPITSVAIMMLAEQGKLRLSDPISRYIPEFSQTRVYESGPLEDMKTSVPHRPITIEDLLAHRSGITYHFMGSTPVHQYYRKYGVKRKTPVGSLPSDGPAAESLPELVSRIAKAPLLSQPGEQFHYSYSTTVLGYLVEIVSGLSLPAFLKQEIFEPLGMDDTGFFVNETTRKRLATIYQLAEQGLEVLETNDDTEYSDKDRLIDGGGAMVGTADDYLRFATMLANRGVLDGVRILSTASVYRMLYPEVTVQGLGDLSGYEFGLGFAIGTAASEAEHIMPEGMYGWAGSGNTHFWIDPERQQAYVVMTQVMTPPGDEARFGLRRDCVQALAALAKE